MSDFALGMICGPFALVALVIVGAYVLDALYAIYTGSLRRAWFILWHGGFNLPRNVTPRTKAWIAYAKAAGRANRDIYRREFGADAMDAIVAARRYRARWYARYAPWLPVFLTPGHLLLVLEVAFKPVPRQVHG